MSRYHFFDFSLEDLGDFLVEQGEKRFRATQLYKWVYGHKVQDFSQMTDISKSFREKLPDLFDFSLPPVVSDRTSVDGTRKFLFDVGDGDTIEAVLIPSPGRLTLCLSTQVGCNMACKFCFTGKMKMKRRLKAHEIVGQFLQADRLLGSDQRISNIVYMGMGEPLDNPENVLTSIQIFNTTIGIGLSRKRITVSTSGLVDRIPLITESGARLAVSLNGVNDEVRSQVMPINNKWNIKELLDACVEHCRITKDKVTFEYVLLKGVTDSIEDARQLYKITRRVPCKINIIPFNEHPGSGFSRPSDSQVVRFQEELMKLGAHVLLRRTKGRDIYAACGQLTSAHKEHPQTMPVQ